MPVCAVKHYGIHSRGHHGFHPFEGIGGNAYAGSYLQAFGLDLGYLGGLGVYRHIFMNNADTSFSCESFGHRRFSHCIHSCGH